MNADEKTMLDLLDRGCLDCLVRCGCKRANPQACGRGQVEAGEA